MLRTTILALAACAAALQISALAKPAAGSVTGIYRGDFDGGGGEVRITGAAPRYKVNIIVGADGCGGGVEGTATADAHGNLAVAPGNGCRVTLTKIARGWAVAETNCSFYHGDSCNFNGAAVRVSH